MVLGKPESRTSKIAEKAGRSYFRRWRRVGPFVLPRTGLSIPWFCAAFLLLLHCCVFQTSLRSAHAAPDEQSTAETDAQAQEADEPNDWQPLFDGKTLKGWKQTDFAGGGKAKVENGELILPFGEILTGVTWNGKQFPKSNYEISLEAQRVDGSDFFCGLTFPVGEEHCSLIVGGWGGSLVGISSIDGYDASENLTTVFEKFENKKWYPIRIRVTDERVQAWIDNRRLVNVEREGKEFSVRWEVEKSRPLGIAAYQSTAGIKDLKFRKLDASE